MILLLKETAAKKVELLARVYDHSEHKFQRGFTMLTLGWTDGYIQDMDLMIALQSLMTLFVNIATTVSAQITEMIKTQVCNWMASQAGFIRALFSDVCWES